MNRVYLVRHGENLANLTKEFSCRTVDYSLTPKGQLQARQTADYFLNKSIDEIYASPLKRAVESAEIIARRLGLKLTIVEAFRELNVGSLEGTQDLAAGWAVHTQVIEAWLQGNEQVRFPDGENLIELVERMQTGLRLITEGKSGKNIIILGHGGLFTGSLPYICRQVQGSWLQSQENHNCSISEILVRQDGGRLEADLVSWAACGHLHGEAANLVSGFPNQNTFSGANSPR